MISNSERWSDSQDKKARQSNIRSRLQGSPARQLHHSNNNIEFINNSSTSTFTLHSPATPYQIAIYRRIQLHLQFNKHQSSILPTTFARQSPPGQLLPTSSPHIAHHKNGAYQHRKQHRRRHAAGPQGEGQGQEGEEARRAEARCRRSRWQGHQEEGHAQEINLSRLPRARARCVEPRTMGSWQEGT